jgi:fumarate reductase subunit C
MLPIYKGAYFIAKASCAVTVLFVLIFFLDLFLLCQNDSLAKHFMKFLNLLKQTDLLWGIIDFIDIG